MLEIHNLSFSFASFEVLSDFSLQLSKGEIGTLIGSSGSGKTTLFKLLAGFLKCTKGSIHFSGKLQENPSLYVAYMTQDDLLLPWRSILDNLMLVGELGKKKYDLDVMKYEAKHYLKEVGLDGWEQAYPHQLSGGMRQRVSLARALLQKKPLLLLDEPFSALDVAMREQMHCLLRDVKDRYRTTILMVTHDFRDAISLSDKIFLLSEGRIDQEWTINSSAKNDPHKFHSLNQQLFSALKGARTT